MNAVQEGDCPDKQSDEALARRAGKGDEDAFACLVHRHMPMVLGLAARYRGPWLEPEDLAQEGLLGLLSAVGPIGRTVRRLSPPMRRSACGTGLSPLSNGPDRSGMSRPPPWKAGTTGTSRDCRMDKPIQSGCFWRGKRPPCMRERLKAVLTELEYQVLMLYLSAYSYEEIAARLHVGAKTVDNALQRVRRKLDASIWREFSQDY